MLPLMGRCRAEILISIALAALTWLAFAPVLENGFVNLDDGAYVTANARVQAGLTPASMAWAVTTTEAANWHPLTWWSLQLDRELYGPSPRGFHFTSLLFHIANVVVLFLALCRMTQAIWPSAAVAAFFAVHPLRVESVAWVAERKDVLSTFFAMLTLAAYASYVKEPRLGRYALVLLLFALGLLAKPMFVTLPCVLLLLDYWPLRRWDPSSPDGTSRHRLVAEKLPLFALAAASCAITVWAQGAGHAILSLQFLPLSTRLATAIVAYGGYLGKTLWPVGLAVFYPQPRLGFPIAQVLGAALLLGGISLLALGMARRRPYLAVGWLWYLGTLVPVIGLVRVGEQALADRYTYFPLIGVFIMLAWALKDLATARRSIRFALAVATPVMLLALLAATRQQVRSWHDGMSLWNHALQVDPDNYFAHYNVAGFLQDQGQLDQARRHLEKALALRPEFTEGHFKLGVLALKSGRFDEAVYELNAIVRDFPDQPMAHNQLGMALAGQGRLPEGIGQLREAVRLDPDDPDAHNNLGLALGLWNEVAESAQHFEAAIRLDPKLAQAHYNLGLALERMGQRRRAIACFQEAVRLKPLWVRCRARLAQALEDSGQIEAARAEYGEIARIDPGWRDRKNEGGPAKESP